MTARRRAIEVSIGGEDLARLVSVTRSRTEPASRVERARMLLVYRDEPSFFQVGRAVGAHHQTVQRCVERALAYGPLAALDFVAWRLRRARWRRREINYATRTQMACPRSRIRLSDLTAIA